MGAGACEEEGVGAQSIASLSSSFRAVRLDPVPARDRDRTLDGMLSLISTCSSSGLDSLLSTTLFFASSTTRRFFDTALEPALLFPVDEPDRFNDDDGGPATTEALRPASELSSEMLITDLFGEAVERESDDKSI